MKKIMNLVLVAALALGVASCTKEEPQGNNGGSDRQLVFSFKGINDGTTTYATVAAETFEKKVNNATVYIYEYKADKSGVLLQVESRDFTTAAPNYLVVVNNTAALTGKKLSAHFVLNNGAAFNTHANLAAFTVANAPTESSFLAATTTALAGKAARQGFLMTASYTPASGFDPYGEHPVTVKRRVARFDIVNSNPAVVTAVTKVTVRSAADKTNVFGDATVAAPFVPIATDVVYDLTAAEYGETGATTLAWTAATPAVASSVFYLNPTKLKKDRSATQIFIEATVGGETKVFELNLPADVEILANTRYKLTLTPDLRFNISVADWDDTSVDVPTTPMEVAPLGLAAAPSGAAVASFLSNVINVNATGGQITFTVKASSNLGTSFVITHDAGLADHSAKINVTEVPSATLTYGAPYYASTYTINVADLTGLPTSFTTITITDKAKPANSYQLGIYHTSVADAGFVRINETTFPDPVFRNFIVTKFGLSVSPTITKFKAVTEVVIPSTTAVNIKSLKGIEYFSNVKNIDVQKCDISELSLTSLTELEQLTLSYTTFKGLVDVSSNLKLKRLMLAQSSISAVKLPINSIITYLNVAKTNVSSLEIKNLNFLEELHCWECTNLSSIEFGEHPALYRIVAFSTPFNEFIIPSLPGLKILNITSTNIKSLDLSKCTNLIELGVGNLPQITTTIDISKNVKLEIFTASRSGFTSINTNSNPELKLLSVGRTNISGLDLNNNTKLETLNIDYTPIETIDISKQNLLSTVNFSECVKLKNVYVWTGFDVLNPSNTITNLYTTNSPLIEFIVK